MTCTIQWNALTLSEWHERFARIRRSNLLQSYEYALAKCAVDRQSARWGLVRIDGAEAGLVQMIEARALGGAMHALIIDRGPLWFNGFGGVDHVRRFAVALNKAFPRRIGRRRRFIPEAENLDSFPGFEKSDAPAYQTIWMDLRQSEDDLRAGLKKRWRGALVKAEKAELTIEWDWSGMAFPDLLLGYVTDKAAKGYDGPSVELLMALAVNFAPQGKKEQKMLIGRALTNNKLCASILVLCHGTSATYQIGWSDEQGRALSAHHRLLWEALGQLKGKNITDFDLGGINETSAKGVKAFKDGMGGQPVTLSGLYS